MLKALIQQYKMLALLRQNKKKCKINDNRIKKKRASEIITFFFSEIIQLKYRKFLFLVKVENPLMQWCENYKTDLIF